MPTAPQSQPASATQSDPSPSSVPSTPTAGHRATHRQITLGLKHDGGTGITNFSKGDADVYREAIRLHGDSALVVSETDFMDGGAGYFSLHDLSMDRAPFGDLSDFWAIFDLVKALYATRKLFGVESCGAADWVRYRNQHQALLAENRALIEVLRDSRAFIASGLEGNPSRRRMAIEKIDAALSLGKGEGQ